LQCSAAHKVGKAEGRETGVKGALSNHAGGGTPSSNSSGFWGASRAFRVSSHLFGGGGGRWVNGAARETVITAEATCPGYLVSYATGRRGVQDMTV
jgi:hypothetical protein